MDFELYPLDRLAKEGQALSTEGEVLALAADTICIHGDGEHAVEFAREIRAVLDQHHIQVAPIGIK